MASELRVNTLKGCQREQQRGYMSYVAQGSAKAWSISTKMTQLMKRQL